MKSRKKRSSNKQKGMVSKLHTHILDALKEKPLTVAALSKKIKLSSSLKGLLQEALDKLVRENKIVVSKNHYALAEPEHLVGRISVHSKGFGFVSVENNPYKKDIFIPKNYMATAIDGDKVEVEVLQDSPKGPEGKVTEIIARGRKIIAGTIRHAEDSYYAVFVPLLGQSKKVYLKKSSTQLKRGDRVMMEIVHWDGNLICDLKEHIGHINDPSLDVSAALVEFGIRQHFPTEVIKQAKECTIEKSVFADRHDSTKDEVITIDPKTAKDFDDALSCTQDKKGNFHLGVHIADVSHFVKANTPLDKEGFERGNSVYFPGTVIPMLPSQLSDELCSLKPNVIRLTISVFMHFSPNGELLSHEVKRSFIKSTKRFTYEEALDVIEKRKKSKHHALLDRLVKLALLLKKKRMERGSIDFALPEAVVEVDTKGSPKKISLVEYDITHQLVEEFMLKANEVVAQTLGENGNVLIYRIHEEPSVESFEDFYAYARLLGFYLPNQPTHKDIQKVFKKAKNTPHFQQLSVAFIRSMKLACYSSDNIGHYGLSLEHYAHFTSPIRRYSDLIIHRLLFEDPIDKKNLSKIAKHCSDKERIAMKAENSVITLKKLRLLQRYADKDPFREYPATVTRIRPFGISFELDHLFFEGSLHISDLGDDYYIYDAKKQAIIGQWSHEIFASGTKILVMIQEVDLILQQANFYLVDLLSEKNGKSPS